MSSPIFDEGLALYHSIQMSEKIGGALQVGATQKGVPHIRVDIRCFCACKYFIKKKKSVGCCVFRSKSQRWQALDDMHCRCFVYDFSSAEM